MSAEDPVIRAAAARALGTLKPAGALEALTQAARSVDKDGSHVARAAALAALVEFGRDTAQPVLVAALADGDWAVGPRGRPASQARPEPRRCGDDPAGADALRLERAWVARRSSRISTQLYIDTEKGTIQVELAMLDAPLAVRTISELARRG